MRAVRPSPAQDARRLAAVGRRFYERGWVLGTSGNFSAIASERPLAMTITASSVHKGRLAAGDFLRVNAQGTPIGRTKLHPSAETLLHAEIYLRRKARAILHTHSTWGTILSDAHGDASHLDVEGYEMLKGLAGVRSHDHRERIPIIENGQDMTVLAKVAGGVLEQYPEAHAFLIRRHGLYTWGGTIDEAERHVEVLEFLFEAIARRATLST